MAKYILLVIADDAEADAFTSAVMAMQETESGHGCVLYSVPVADSPDEYKMESLTTVSVRAAFQKPTRFCECVRSEREKLEEPQARGKKYGFWVHRECGKPVRGNWQHPRNLLDPRPTIERDCYLGIVEGAEKYTLRTRTKDDRSRRAPS